MAISLPEETPLPSRDCHAPLAVTVPVKLGTRERIYDYQSDLLCDDTMNLHRLRIAQKNRPRQTGGDGVFPTQ